MIRHFFLDKTNTIIKGSMFNMGLNPILQIGYGNTLMRGLLHFDIGEIKSLINDKTFANLDKLKFTLKMTNCFSVDTFPYEKELIRGLVKSVHRAGAFDLMLFKLPCDFDQGRGFDYISDFWNHDKTSYNKNSSNWYLSKGNSPWEYERIGIDVHDPNTNWVEVMRDLEGGVYSQETIINEYYKYLSGETSIIINTQHFDYGNEELSMDITDYVIGCVNGDENWGLCLAFTPEYEFIYSEEEQYVGFFSDCTNTFFHPYVEAEYDEYINDNRDDFTIGVNNRLYLYSSNEDEMVNLDENPICTINGVEFVSKQAKKGIYYVDIPPYTIEMGDGMILYDKWSNIIVNGYNEEDVEMEVPVHSKSHKVNIGPVIKPKKDISPIIYGINDNEKLTREEIREVVVDFRKIYEKEKSEIVSNAEWRLYVMDGNREINIFKYTPIEKSYLHNFFIVNTNDLIPNEYYVDIRVISGNETKYYRRALKFTIISSVSKRYQ